MAVQKRKNGKRKQRRTPEFLRARNENRLGMMVAMMAILIMTAVVGVNSISLKQKEEQYAAREQELISQIEAEEKRAEEIEEYRKYTQTQKYVEEVAKEKLGLVNENEIIFKSED